MGTLITTDLIFLNVRLQLRFNLIASIPEWWIILPGTIK